MEYKQIFAELDAIAAESFDEGTQYFNARERENYEKLCAELDAIFAEPASEDTHRTITVKVDTPTRDVHALLDAYQERVAENAKQAEIMETDIYSDINTYGFAKGMVLTSVKIEAVIDWLDLRFTVDPAVCSFHKAPEARSHIKAFLTRETGTRHYIKPDDSDVTQDGESFTIRLHDIRNAKDLRRITDLLKVKYGAQYDAMTIEAIELSLDLYNARNTALLVALHKSMLYSEDASKFRIYKTKGTQRSIPTSPSELVELLNEGYNIGMGDHRTDGFCIRAYFKRTDKGGLVLPSTEHRLRFEVTLTKSVFKHDGVDCHLKNLSQIITHGFKKVRFTKLSKHATTEERFAYRHEVQPFGKEQPIAISRSRHQRTLPDGIEVHSQLNEARKTAVRSLSKKF